MRVSYAGASATTNHRRVASIRYDIHKPEEMAAARTASDCLEQFGWNKIADRPGEFLFEVHDRDEYDVFVTDYKRLTKGVT